jgi:uncharacterized protein (TIGR01244 family)
MGDRPTAVVVGLVLVALQGCATLQPRKSAQSLPHFLSVDECLYRGGQPTGAGFSRLAELGVKTVVSLRAEDVLGQRQEQQLVESLGMRWVHLPMRMYGRPSDEQVLTFLELVSDPSQQPVFVHCRKGEDRTGALVAIYRIARQGWEPERAYDEAVSLGMTSLNPFMRYVILYETQQQHIPAVASLR